MFGVPDDWTKLGRDFKRSEISVIVDKNKSPPYYVRESEGNPKSVL